MTNKKGKITRLAKKLNAAGSQVGLKKTDVAEQKNENTAQYQFKQNFEQNKRIVQKHNREKNYMIKENAHVPFLQALGVMNSSGKVVASKYAKFRQINRFLEFIDDALPAVMAKKQEEAENSPLKILDFGSGKSYLTFAVHYYLSEIKKVDFTDFSFSIVGIDLKREVVENCSALARQLSLKNIEFICGDIAQYSEKDNPDIVITLHACDTATDYALDYAVKRKAKAILSVPCCQHEINLQLEKNRKTASQILRPLLKYGIVRERFAALVTDSVRAALLENAGYNVQVLEFIDTEGTPKNLLIRAVLKNDAFANANSAESAQYGELLTALGVEQTLYRLLN